MFHVPWYNSNAGHFKEAERHRAALERTLFDAGWTWCSTDTCTRTSEPSRRSTPASRPVRRRASRRRRRRELRGTLRRRLARPTAGVERVPRGLFRRGSVGDSLDETHATWEWRRTTCVAPLWGTNDAGEPRYAPTGDHGEECHSVGDVSAQAMRAVDRAVFVRDVEACPNRRAGSGAAPESLRRLGADGGGTTRTPRRGRTASSSGSSRS